MKNKNNVVLFVIVIFITLFNLTKGTDVSFDRIWANHSRQSENSTKNNIAKLFSKQEHIVKVDTIQREDIISDISELNTSQEENLSDREILAKIIHAEAGGEPYEGKVAVGAVVLNRVINDEFKDTIKEVVMSPNHFQSVSIGLYQKAKPSERDYKAADEVLSGVDPTGGALYFYSPIFPSVRWHETLTHTTTIGRYRFFK